MSNALLIHHLPLPTASGSIEAYVQTANRMPMLSESDELSLARRLRDEDDLDAARQLVLSHLRLKNWRLVKVATTKAQRKLFFNLRSMKKGFATLTPDEVNAMAKQLGVKPKEVVEMETRLTGQDMSLEPLSEDEDERFAPIAYLAADIANEPSAMLERKEYDRLQTDGLSEALGDLDERSRDIVVRRWLAEDGEAPTLHDLAAEYGVSAERIRQIEVKALQKMRGTLGAAA